MKRSVRCAPLKANALNIVLANPERAPMPLGDSVRFDTVDMFFGAIPFVAVDGVIFGQRGVFGT